MTTVSMTAAVNDGAARKNTVGKQGIVPNAQMPHRPASAAFAARGRVEFERCKYLRLDTSTEVCAVALGDGVTWHEKSEVAGQRHSELLLPMIRALLADGGVTLKQIDGIAFGAGPGSFTGLRIACGVAQGSRSAPHCRWWAYRRSRPLRRLGAIAPAASASSRRWMRA